MDHLPFRSASFSRRRFLSLTAGTVAASIPAPGQQTAAHDPATPAPDTAGAPVAGDSAAAPHSLSSSLDADASPEFRVVVEAVVAAMRKSQVPGAAIGLLAGDREEHATVGRASLSSMRPVTPETLFQIGSLSKTYTGTVTWRLIDEGALDLDAPVRTYIPDFTLLDEAAAAEVTVANLLDHSAGWYGDGDFASSNDDGMIARYVAEEFPHLPQSFPVGEFFSYNNACFTLLGRLIEVVTGTIYNAAMANLLLGPLGLRDSLLDHAAVRQRPYTDGHIAMPINGHPAVTVQTPLWVPRFLNPTGGLWSTTRDVLRYGRFHSAAGTVSGAANVVSPDSLRQMREPAMPISGTSIAMGRNWFVLDVAGTRIISHAGDTNGHHADFFAIPEQHFILVVLTNSQGGGGAVTLAALQAALTQFPALASLSGKDGLIALLAPPAAPTTTIPAEELAAYAGRYANPAMVLTFARQGAGLELTTTLNDEAEMWPPAIRPPAPPPAPVSFLARDLASVNGVRMPFVRDAHGRVRWVASGLRLIPRVEP